MIDSTRAARWIRTLNLVLQAVLFLTFVGGLNYLARSHAWRFDLTRYRRYSLSAETLAYLHELSRPVHIVVTFDGQTDNPEVEGLLREYVYATEANSQGRVTVEYVDIYQNRRTTEKYGIEQPGIILLLCGEKRRALTEADLYRAENRVLKSFVGEQAVTDGILDVSNPERKKIFFLVGHGELRPDDVDPAGQLHRARQRRGPVGREFRASTAGSARGEAGCLPVRSAVRCSGRDRSQVPANAGCALECGGELAAAAVSITGRLGQRPAEDRIQLRGQPVTASRQ